MFNRKDYKNNKLDEYFARIGYEGLRTVSEDTLKGIAIAHSRSIPFENLSIHEQKNVDNRDDFIKLDIDSVFNKLVREKRGGYCLETNELLAFVLTELNFNVERLLARSLARPNLARGHKMLLVTLEDEKKWIVDVGFGGHGLFEPIPLIFDQEFNQQGYRFQLIQGEVNHTLQYFLNEKWNDLLEFSLEACAPHDYRHFNYAISHDPESFFVNSRICIIAIPNGRITLHNYNLKIMSDGNEINKTLTGENDYFKCLKEYFAIEFPALTPLKDIPVMNKPISEIEKKTNTKDLLEKRKSMVWCSYFAGDLFDFSKAKNINSSLLNQKRMN